MISNPLEYKLESQPNAYLMSKERRSTKVEGKTGAFIYFFVYFQLPLFYYCFSQVLLLPFLFYIWRGGAPVSLLCRSKNLVTEKGGKPMTIFEGKWQFWQLLEPLQSQKIVVFFDKMYDIFQFIRKFQFARFQKKWFDSVEF